MVMQNILDKLKDIRVEETVSYLPIAYGWWVCLFSVILLCFIVLVIRKLYKYNLKRNAHILINSFRSDNVVENAIHVSTSLRKILITRNEKNIENLFGVKWYQFLNKENNFILSDVEKELFLNAPYVDKATNKFDNINIDNIYLQANRWVSNLK